jgi:hypothetical protein
MARETGSTWGTPIATYSGNRDGFVAEFKTSGIRQWNTFFGSDEYETVYDMNADNSRIHVCGESDDSWETPIYPHSGQYKTKKGVKSTFASLHLNIIDNVKVQKIR